MTARATTPPVKPSRADLLRQARAALGKVTTKDGRPMPQETFARRCGWSVSMQHKYESGANTIGDHVLEKVAKVLDRYAERHPVAALALADILNEVRA
jgi:transcriptional regulator with XRE-family HTH domain